MSYKPDNITHLSPYMVVKDAKESMDFYNKAFGFTLEYVADDENGNPQHVSMKKNDATIMFCPEGSYGTTKKSPARLGIQMPINMYVYCEDVDALYQQAIAEGAKSVMKPQDSFWGDRFCSILDKDNYEWCFATKIQ